MAEPNLIDGSICSELLREAAQRSVTIDLIRLLKSGPDPCRSRFVELPSADLAVELPSRLGRPVPVRPGERLEIHFRIKEYRYCFRTTVRSRSKVALSELLEVAILLIVPPLSVERCRRRQFLRVKVTAAERLMAHLWLVDDSRPQGDALRLPSTEVLDISGTGMRLLLEGSMRGRIKEGQQVHLHMDLGGGWEPLNLVAHVEHLDRTAHHVVQFGLHFDGLDETLEGRAAHNRLLRFIAERERKEARRVKALKGR